jgi:hypothetical protein
VYGFGKNATGDFSREHILLETPFHERDVSIIIIIVPVTLHFIDDNHNNNNILVKIRTPIGTVNLHVYLGGMALHG